MIQWKKVLSSLGFSESEANIYLTALELGPSTVQDLARRAKVSRVTTYAVIKSLSDLGLMSSLEKGKKKFFAAESPERLVSFVSGRVKNMEATLKEVESSMHELKLIQRGEKPVVKMFEGVEGIKAITDDILKTRPDTTFEIGNIQEMQKVLSAEMLKPFKESLEKQKVKTLGIYIADETFKPRPSTQVKYITTKEPPFTGDLIVYSDKIALSTFLGKHISVLIENRELAETMKEVFKLAWKGVDKAE